jgi:hypothetical protein
LPLNRGFLF